MEPIDICYTPLDIPKRPDIDLLKFNNWVKEVYPQPCKKKAIHAEKDLTIDYTWDLAFGLFDGQWQNDFDKEFPELASYCYEGFGVHRHEIGTIVFLPVRETVSGTAFWHNDIDSTGFRFYLECEHHEENPLLLRKTVIPYTTMSAIVIPLNGDDDRVQKEVHNCKMTDPHMSFYLNNYRAVHAPTVNVPGMRIAGFITIDPRYSADVRARSREMIIASANKFKDYAILW